MCFSETWLNENDSDDSLDIEGFTIIRSDRTGESGNKTAEVSASTSINYGPIKTIFMLRNKSVMRT